MSAVGYGTLRYEWKKIGNDTTRVECTETETDTLTISSFSHKHQGSYTCTVYDDHKSVKSEPFNLILGMEVSLVLFLFKLATFFPINSTPRHWASTEQCMY